MASLYQKKTTQHSVTQQQAHPYKDATEIQSINTGMTKQWKYSPLFIHPDADVYIQLTGSRLKDYRIAEKAAGKIHIPCKTVWHHTWEKSISGEYRVQLVEYDLHKSTCPHAGGCRRWEAEHNRKYKSYLSACENSPIYINEKLKGKHVRGMQVLYTGQMRDSIISRPYSDFVIDYIFNQDENTEPLLHIAKCNSRSAQKKKIKIWGLDPYGNIYLKGKKGKIFFLNMETGVLSSMGISENDILG